MTGDFSNGPFKLSEPLTTEVTGSYPPSSFPSWQLQNQDSVGHLCCRHAHTFIEIPTRHRYSLLSTSHTYLHIGALSHTRTHAPTPVAARREMWTRFLGILPVLAPVDRSYLEEPSKRASASVVKTRNLLCGFSGNCPAFPRSWIPSGKSNHDLYQPSQNWNFWRQCCSWSWIYTKKAGSSA